MRPLPAMRVWAWGDYERRDSTMPFYDYGCPSCDHRFEVLQKLGDPAPAQCPACGHERVEKLVSAPAIQSGGGGGHVHGPNCRH